MRGTILEILEALKRYDLLENVGISERIKEVRKTHKT